MNYYQNERQQELKKLERIKRKQEEYKRGIWIGLGVILLGLFFAYFWALFPVPLFTLIVINLLVSCYGVFMILRGIIHSDWPVAVRVSEMLPRATLHMKKEECVANIIVYEQRAKKLEELKNQMNATEEDSNES